MKVFLTPKTSTYTLLLCLLLSACGREPNTKPPEPVQPIDQQTTVDATPEAEPETETETEPETINLSTTLLDDIVDEGVDGSVNPRKKLLPDLFEPTEADMKTSVSGGLLLNAESEEIRDMLEGVEVKIEIPTG